jgi:hypothetical protein
MASAAQPVQMLNGSPGLAMAVQQCGIAGAELIGPSDDPCIAPRGIVLVELEALSDAAWQKVLRLRPDGTGVVLIGGIGLKHHLVELFERGAVRHILGADGTPDLTELKVTVDKLRGDAPFGTAAYVGATAGKTSLKISRSSDKAAAIAEAQRFATDAGVAARQVSSFCTVVDEFVTNAIYNAPVDASGQRRFAHLSRGVEVVLGPEESVDVELSFDAGRLGVAVFDPFGSLTARRVQESMARCLRRGGDQVAQKPGGAGIGLYYSYELLSRFVVEIVPQCSTLALGVLDTRGGYRAFAARPKSFDVFVKSEGQVEGSAA